MSGLAGINQALNQEDFAEYQKKNYTTEGNFSLQVYAYDRVGIIRNVIDLMGDFGSQGIDIVHPNKAIERFYRKWFSQINGIERSERFLNYLYRTGNVVIKRRTAKISPSKEEELRKAAGAADIEIVNTKIGLTWHP
jgi:hypothetical protein